MEAELDREIERLVALQAVNRHVRPEEIELATEERAALGKHLRGARLRLDAVRVVWRGPAEFFDTPSRSVCSVKPTRTNTPLHALTTLNNVTFVEAARALAERVMLEQNEEPGSIIVDTKAHKLYFVLPGKKAYEYPISVGRDGFTWTGTERISRIAAWPSWTPPPEMHQRMQGLPVTVTGGLLNPHGARALYLGNTIYRIHGTNNDRTVGRANSSGCF